MLYSPPPRLLHEYVCTLSLKAPQFCPSVRHCFREGKKKLTHCSLLLTASKTLPFSFTLASVFWLNTHQEANPVSGNTASKSYSGYTRICTKRGRFSTLGAQKDGVPWTEMTNRKQFPHHHHSREWLLLHFWVTSGRDHGPWISLHIFPGPAKLGLNHSHQGCFSGMYLDKQPWGMRQCLPGKTEKVCFHLQ